MEAGTIAYGIFKPGEVVPPPAGPLRVYRVQVLGSWFLDSRVGYRVKWAPAVGYAYARNNRDWFVRPIDLFETEEVAERECFKRRLATSL